MTRPNLRDHLARLHWPGRDQEQVSTGVGVRLPPGLQGRSTPTGTHTASVFSSRDEWVWSRSAWSAHRSTSVTEVPGKRDGHTHSPGPHLRRTRAQPPSGHPGLSGRRCLGLQQLRGRGKQRKAAAVSSTGGRTLPVGKGRCLPDLSPWVPARAHSGAAPWEPCAGRCAVHSLENLGDLGPALCEGGACARAAWHQLCHVPVSPTCSQTADQPHQGASRGQTRTPTQKISFHS